MKHTFLALLAMLAAAGGARAQSSITAAEYFFDADPGSGSATPINVAMAGQTVSLSASVPVSSLGAGFHVLAARTRNTAGVWSMMETRGVFVLGNPVNGGSITAAEYFVDADPGLGAGTPVSVGTPGSTVAFAASVPTSALAPGFHLAVMRVQDAGGRWSISEKSGFYVIAAPLNSGFIAAAEYFVDADPGLGSGTPVAVGAPGSTASFGAVVPVSGLAPGFHQVSVRVRNSAGFWSLHEHRGFFVIAPPIPGGGAIAAAEYFFDTDPGVGAATALAVGTPAAQVSFSPVIPVSGLAPGFHHLAVRVQDASGRWSLHESRGFFIIGAPANTGDVIAAEYFLDNDPGIGAGTPVAVATPGVSVSFGASVPTAALAPGFHTLAVRVKNSAGYWSMVEHRGLYILPVPALPLVTAAEYFVDTDPGTGNASALSLGTPAGSVSFAASIPTSSLVPGMHLLSVRVRNGVGKWGLYEQRGFFVSGPAAISNIVAAEYFVDTDPGVGAASTLAVPAPGSQVSFAASVPTAGLTRGMHLLTIRTKNSGGLWSLFETRGFYVREADSTGPVPIVAGEWFLDSDPGVGAASAYLFAQPADSVTGPFDAQIPYGTAPGQHILASRVMDSTGTWTGLEYDTITVSSPLHFVFTGTGSWMADSNWLESFPPPAVLPARGSITISGTGPADLDTVQGVDSGARLVILPAKSMNVLASTGTLNLQGSLDDSGSLAWNAAIALVVDVDTGMKIWGPGSISIAAPKLSVKDTLALAAGVTLTADTLALDGRVETAGPLVLKPALDATSIGIGAGAGTFHLSATEIARLADGASSITLGRAGTGTGPVDIRGAIFTDPLAVHGGRVKVTGLNAGSNAVSITALTGNILDSSDVGTDITAGTLALSAPAGALAPGASPGIFSVDGSYNHSGVLQMEVAGLTPGAGHDQLAVTGAVTVGGTLNVSFVGGFTGASGDTMRLVTGAPVTGTFATVNVPTGWSLVYTPTAVSLVKPGTPLPMLLLGFAGEKNSGGGADLHWDVAQEHGVARYEVERSTDAQNFEAIGTQAANGRNRYSLPDNAPPVGAAYYRLKVVEQSGDHFYSGVVRLVFDKSGHFFAVHPNPTEGWVTVQASAKIVRIQLVDAAGKTVLDRPAAIDGRCDLGGVPAGVYLLRAVGEDGRVEVQRVVRR